jgi:antitoxin component of RelBE/YafQ-DinJ toxin-antitoxin module
MSDNKSQLATFRVEPELWEAFKAQARKNGLTASDVLNDFVQNYVSSGTIAEPSQLDNLDVRIEEKVIESLAPIQQELAELKAALAELNNLGKSAA